MNDQMQLVLDMLEDRFPSDKVSTKKCKGIDTLKINIKEGLTRGDLIELSSAGIDLNLLMYRSGKGITVIYTKTN
ncbi:hypothetical protein LCGC14_1629340 [marine sediment metagenome]|uniref:Uncharacterized protein n=1 Tax=marine sediment metagenome TaxID=412755 RepID=A0A0F9KIT2_9ZZZZ